MASYSSIKRKETSKWFITKPFPTRKYTIFILKNKLMIANIIEIKSDLLLFAISYKIFMIFLAGSLVEVNQEILAWSH